MSYLFIELILKLVLFRIIVELVWVCVWFLSVIFFFVLFREDSAFRRDGIGVFVGEDGVSGRGF